MKSSTEDHAEGTFHEPKGTASMMKLRPAVERGGEYGIHNCRINCGNFSDSNFKINIALV